MKEKIQSQDSINKGKQKTVMQGVEKETDRLQRGMQKTSEKESQNREDMDSIQRPDIQKISGGKRKTGSIGLNDLEKQKLIEQYLLQKNKNSLETKSAEKNRLSDSNSAIPEKALDKLSDGLNTLEETVEELSVIQNDNAEDLAVTEVNHSQVSRHIFVKKVEEAVI